MCKGYGAKIKVQTPHFDHEVGYMRSEQLCGRWWRSGARSVWIWELVQESELNSAQRKCGEITLRQDTIPWNRIVVSELIELVGVMNPGGENNVRWTRHVDGYGCILGFIEEGLRDLSFFPAFSTSWKSGTTKIGEFGGLGKIMGPF